MWSSSAAYRIATIQSPCLQVIHSRPDSRVTRDHSITLSHFVHTHRHTSLLLALLQHVQLLLGLLLGLRAGVWVADCPVFTSESASAHPDTLSHINTFSRERNLRFQTPLDICNVVSVIVDAAGSLIAEDALFLGRGREVEFGAERVCHGRLLG